MEDNSSDDKLSDLPLPPTPKLAGKKLKLNDGSSQDCLLFPASSRNPDNDEVVDSAVSNDKSESMTNDDQVLTTVGGPSNEVINAAPSGSNVRALLLNIRKPRHGRNYRKRKTSGRDSDSNDSSRDSDDLSAEENPSDSRPIQNSYSETESDDLQGIALGGTASDDASTDSNEASESEDMIQLEDSESEDDEMWSRANNEEDNDQTEVKSPQVLLKSQPKPNYLLVRDLINREMGLTFPYGKTTKSDVMFEQNFYGSLRAVYRLNKIHVLNKHKGCVNSINFHPEGQLLASGSDDTHVVVWDWAKNCALQVIKTGHKSNVFQSKFLHLNARSQLNIVTCARDGQVRLLQCPPSGGTKVSRRRLATHSRAAHKLHVSAMEPHIVISAGEDGLVMQCDVRTEPATRLFQVKEQSVIIPLYSINGHPFDNRKLVVAGRDKFVRVYDRRKSSRPLAMYCPTNFNNNNVLTKGKVKLSMMHLTCAIYNHDGSEILGSYNDENIYLFDTKCDVFDKDNSDVKDGYSHHYTGHRNSATFKGVAFFGPKSQYIVSGSDCSYIYVWEKNSEAIVQWMRGDENGVVNCIETHPRSPVLAASGLDRDIKIWAPTAENDPTFEGLERVVRGNSLCLRSPLFNDFLPTIYSHFRGERLFSDDDGGPPYGGNIEFEGNVCTMS